MNSGARKFRLPSLGWLVLALLLVASSAARADTAAQTVVHMLDYIRVDYPQFVKNGKVVNAEEYKEQKEFSGQVVELLGKLPDNAQRAALTADAARLKSRVDAKAPGEEVAKLASGLRWKVIEAYRLVVAPRAAPDPKRGAMLYGSLCTSCHGPEGRGDGPAGSQLDPKPSNFHDGDRMAQRSLYGIYTTITLGVKGTAMASFGQLPEDDRWALAFHVGGLATDAAARARGEALWQAAKGRQAFPDLAALATLSPREVRERHGDEASVVREYLVEHPEAIARARPSPIVFARQQIAGAVDAYRKNDRAAAQQSAVRAYLEGYELIEASLANADSELMREGERNMMVFRDLIRRGAPVAEVEAQAALVNALLERARERLDAGSLSPGTVFTSALVILLREGLEALLVVAAIVAFLIKANRRDALRWVHAGWIGAIVLGLLTWVVASYAIEISGAHREVTEGVTGLIAAVMLVYVGFWLHNKSSTHAWQSFIKDTVGGALARSTLWTMAGVSFLAVYREMFETVLFYQALWVQSGDAGKGALTGGLAAGVASLAAIGWGIFRYSVRLPLGPFFNAMSALMCVLAVVLAGKGIAALQEAGVVAATGLPFVTVPLLGIFPTMQSLGAQLIVLAVIVIGFYIAGRSADGRDANGSAHHHQQPS